MLEGVVTTRNITVQTRGGLSCSKAASIDLRIVVKCFMQKLSMLSIHECVFRMQ